MNFTFFCLVITICTNWHGIFGLSDKGIVCILDKGKTDPICTKIEEHKDVTRERSFSPYDLYVLIPNAAYYKCSKIECAPIELYSITQVTDPSLNLKACDLKLFTCETIRYNYLNNEDKLRFLTASVGKKSFYSVDCLVYDSGRVCHDKMAPYSHVKLLDTGKIARPNETGILSEDDLLCEQGSDGDVTCDINAYVPITTRLVKVKDSIDYKDVLLKSGTYLIPLKMTCDDGCFLKGQLPSTRRQFRYGPPGGDVYRCYYANKQQICKKMYSIHDSMEAVRLALD